MTNKDQGFFIPHRYHQTALEKAPKMSYLPTYFAQSEARFLKWLKKIEQYEQPFKRFDHAAPPSPRWQQDWFTGLDGAIAYILVCELKPRRIIEIGSGHSTRFMMQAIFECQNNTQLFTIDPKPRADLRKFAKQKALTWFDTHIQNLDLSLLPRLEKGDFLFVDSSHILMPGSDVDVIFSQIMPSLSHGVYVHFHDIFMPEPYPCQWQWRAYNEQNALALWLSQHRLNGRSATIEWASHYVRHHLLTRDQSQIKLPQPIAKCAQNVFETSLWLTI
ncbi:MAG: class I SAM-dependent methyltransferase [Pseudomonadota bacterium]